MNCQPGEQEGEGMRKIQLGSIKGSQHKQKIPPGPGPTRGAGQSQLSPPPLLSGPFLRQTATQPVIGNSL